ncbi:HAD family hydrolase [Naumannella halotolerans]|uniref:Sugar-phosphatase n=1 Tax=Naumannella halotolerans TaxID=993414 RepID=A0A4R7J2Y6_9ACTN|nr:HAD-IA family hydrolase [Naumannella halotolerans]TDT30836.1 sugar-phosphatase [Naumannella halotolerans]
MPSPQPDEATGFFGGRDFAAVIFDMDGTLIDSTPAVNRSWTTWAIEYQLTREQMSGHHGVPAAAIVAELLPPDQHAAAVDRITELELADVDDVVPLPGAERAMIELADAPHAIATSCTMPLAQARLRASELLAPDVLVTADQVERGKPAPDPFLLAARQLGVDPTDCLVVEDAPQGLLGAKAAGCATLAVVTTNPREVLAADLVVDDLSAVAWQVVDGRIRVVPAESADRAE